MPLRIGYAGLGSLGSAIFPNLVSFASEQGFPAPSVWNRSQGKYDAIKERFPDVHTAENLLELLNCNVVFTCLANDAAAEDVYGQLVNGLDEGNGKGRAGYRLVMFADQSTLKVETTLKIKKLVEGVGAVYLTTPVFGQPAAARAKQLVCVNSGIYDGRKIVAPMLKAIGKHTIDVGDDNAKGASLKLLGNSIILGAVQLYAESYALSDAIGFDPAVFHELHQNVFAAPALLNYSNKISKGKFGDAGFTVTGGLKDAGHILSLAPEMGLSVSLPTIERAKKNLERARDEGHGDLDWAALASVVRADAGLPPFREGTDKGKQSAL